MKQMNSVGFHHHHYMRGGMTMKHHGNLTAQKGETLESLLSRHGSHNRPKSNFSNAKYLPNGVVYTDVTVE